MNRIKIRQAKIGDLRDIIELERRAWGETKAATLEIFKSRIETFSEGTLVAVLDGEIIGVVSTEIVDYDWKNKTRAWHEITDNGYIAKTHNLKGNILYGVDLGVSPEAPKGTGTQLLECVAKLAIRYDLECGMLGGRMPGYHKYADKYTPEEYLKLETKTKNGTEPLDPEIKFYLRAGLKIVRVIPNYFQDPESLNYGVLLLWPNPFYNRWYRKIAAFLFKI